MSTKGSRPFARLTMSANVAFTDGIPLVIPFNTVEFISDSFGEIVFTASLGGTLIFACQSGVYSMQAQFQVNTGPTTMIAVMNCVSNSAFDSSSTKLVSGYSQGTAMLNANRLISETAFTGNPAGFPVAAYCLLSMTGGGSGNIVASGTQMLIEQLTTY